jgi:hypothetical protein
MEPDSQTIDGIRARNMPTASSRRRRRQIDPFIALNVPLAWAVAATRAGAGDVAWAVLYCHGLAKRAPFAASANDLAATCASEDTARRQFHRLEKAGLVHVERLPGRKPIITVITDQIPTITHESTNE